MTEALEMSLGEEFSAAAVKAPAAPKKERREQKDGDFLQFPQETLLIMALSVHQGGLQWA